MSTNFSGPVVSTGGFTGDITGAVTGNVTGNVATSSLNVGSGGALSYIKKVTVSVNPASLNGATYVEQSVTVTGAATGDIVLVNPVSTIDAGILVAGAYVSAADTVKVRLYNTTVGAIDIAAGNWIFVLIR